MQTTWYPLRFVPRDNLALVQAEGATKDLLMYHSSSDLYYPEGARNMRELVTYLQYEVDSFRKQYSNPAFIIAGDFNLTDKK